MLSAMLSSPSSRRIVPVAARALLVLPALASSARGSSAGDPWITFEGGEGPGRGRSIVLVSGDEEYRSEEALPMLAKILAREHGFRCTVLFAIDPKDGTIDPTQSASLPGLEALDQADLMILFTRFRHLPDADMRHVVDYVVRGRPLIAIRTATHAFAYPKDSTSPYASWSWDSEEWPGGFGKQVLGETWVAHHGDHGKQSTRGVIPDAAREHPILRGVANVWGPTDVYAIGPLPADAHVLLEGSVQDGMTADAKPLEGKLNAPRMPIAWTRERPVAGGRKQRIFTATIGAASDLACEDLRRLYVNASYWCVGLEAKIPAKSAADCVGSYEPSAFGFGTHKHGVRPADLALSAAK
jgi:hypothetical protein